jgi:outer membrane protein assembly factor BamB
MSRSSMRSSARGRWIDPASPPRSGAGDRGVGAVDGSLWVPARADRLPGVLEDFPEGGPRDVMPLTLRCSCGREVPFEEEDRGADVYCPSCGRACAVPAGSAEGAGATASPATVVAAGVAAPPSPPASSAPGAAQPRREAAGAGLPTQVRWIYPGPGAGGPGRLPLRNCPAVDAEGRILAGLQGEVVALTGGGEVSWSYPIGGHVPGSPALGPDGVVRVHASDGLLHGIDRDGRGAWPPVEAGEPLGWASPSVDGDGTTWICPASGGLIRVDRHGHRAPGRPFFRSPHRLDSTGLIHDGVLYVGAEFDACVFAIRLGGERGEDLWDHAAGRGRTGWSIHAALALGEGPLLLVPCRDDHVYAFRLDGTLAWEVPLPGQVRGSLVVDGRQRLYLGVSHAALGQEERGELVCLDAATRAPCWRYRAAAPIESTPVLGEEGTIYFGDNAGVIHAVDPEGRGCWRQDVGSPIRSPGTIAGPGLLVFGLDTGGLIALECASRRLAGRAWPKFRGRLEQAGIGPGA